MLKELFDMKQKLKYDVNISLLFIFGISFLVWGIYLAITGFINRQGLKHMTVISKNTSDYNLSNIKKGDYINFSYINMSGSIDSNTETFFPICSVDATMYSLSDIESYYYAVNFSSSDKYYVLKVGNSCDDFNDFIDHNSTYSSQQNINKFTYDFLSSQTSSDLPKKSFTVKVVKPYAMYDSFCDDFKDFAKEVSDTSDSLTPPSLSLSTKYMLEMVDVHQERQKLIVGIFIIIAGAVLLIFSNPSQILTKRNVIEDKAFNLMYSTDSELTATDVRVISDVAHDLRLKISYYKYKYSQIWKTLRNSLIASVITSFMAVKLQILSALYIIALLCIIKTVVNIIKLIINRNTSFGVAICSIFDREPIQKTIYELQLKLSKCESVINEEMLGEM